MTLAADVGLAGLALRLQRVEFLFETFLGGFAGVDRAALTVGVSSRHRRPPSARRPAAMRATGAEPTGSVQPEEQRSRPSGAGDLSGDRGQRAVVGALPREANIEHQNFIGSTPPLPHQPGSGLQLGAEACGGRSGLLQLLCDLVELALQLRAAPAQGNFLHPVCDCSYQQLAAKTWRSIGLIETAPLLTQVADVELEEARERLLAGIVLSGDHSRHGLAILTGASRYTDWPFSALLRVTSRPAWRRPVMAARTVCGNQPSRWPISATDAPSGRSSMPISIARFVLAGGRSAPGTLAVLKSP